MSNFEAMAKEIVAGVGGQENIEAAVVHPLAQQHQQQEQQLERQQQVMVQHQW